ncbi:anthranilate synthase component I family protein [Nesterenkonia ebinurensis]|uniref:anthranilate synthase component I family protein n=1 Tax=Nesterenkonia ebinurensis TaxID=2608252 RepID=UPI00168A5E38|nr:anthranilate synthase component I family protein [Nesterenkonia ebinurensis]
MPEAVDRTTVPFPAQEDRAAELFGVLRRQLGPVPMAFLDSSDHARTPAPARSRYSILAFSLGRFAETVALPSDAFDWLGQRWPRLDAPDGHRAASAAPFQLGWVGWIGYEGQAQLLRATHAVVVDHQAGAAEIQWVAGDPQPGVVPWVELVGASIQELSSAPRSISGAVTGPTPRLEQLTVRDSRLDYLAKISQAQQEIYQGNTYEVCLTTAITGRLIGCPWEAYLQLRARNRAPFTQFIGFPQRGTAPACAILSTSPERFASISTTGVIRSEPIKGTRPRGTTPDDDAAQLADLRSHPKDRAENVMIADLVRNDLSIHAVPGTLHTERLCAVESYPTVHQMVSTISAQLAPGASPARALNDAFPPGSMTGAPKISTMEILRSLETGPRGAYSGVAGWFSTTGACDLSVLIRTVVCVGGAPEGVQPSTGSGDAEQAHASTELNRVTAGAYATTWPAQTPICLNGSHMSRFSPRSALGRLAPAFTPEVGASRASRLTGDLWEFHLGLGGAITADSNPEAEWQEVIAKSRGVLDALGAVFPEG